MEEGTAQAGMPQENEYEYSEADPSSEEDEGDRDTDVSDSAMLALAGSSQQMRDQLDALAKKHESKGDNALKQQQWQMAVHEYTTALKYAKGVQHECMLLSKRSEALCGYCKHLRSIPARTSEHRALYGHDPTHLAQLAIKDAEKASQLRPTWTQLNVCRGAALFLLERYSDAESAYLEGLALDPNCETLQQGLQQVQQVLVEQEKEQQQLLAEVRRTAVEGAGLDTGGTEAAGYGTAEAAGQVGGSHGGDAEAVVSPTAKRQRRFTNAADRDDFECILCLKLLYEPVTTPCGHTFCKGCFARSMDHGNRCPMCRTVLHVSRELPVTITLQNIISKAFPAEYAARVQEALQAAGAAAAAEAGGDSGAEKLTLPLFVMSTLLPGEKMALNIFEPRYRLMVRRVMEGNRKFGMATVGRSGPEGVDEIAVEAEITDCQMQPDGRYYLEIVGRRRIRITRCWDLDGYRVASANIIKDKTPTSSSKPSGSSSSDGTATAAGNPVNESAAANGVTTTTATEAPSGAEAAVENPAHNNSNSSSSSVSQLVDSVVDSCDQLVERLRSVMASRRVGAAHVRELFDRLGDKPSRSDPEAVSWWAGRLLLLVAPSNTESWLRRELMAVDSTQQRLKMLQDKLGGRLEGAGIAACTIM